MRLKKMMKMAAVGSALAVLLAGCGSDDTDAEASEKDGVRTVKVAYAQSSKPVNYTDESGNPNGYDVRVLQAVDELLPEYEFEFVGTSDDDLLVGVEQGKYQIGIKNAFYTEERAAKFIYPEQFIGLSSTGLILKKEDAQIETLEQFAEADYSLAPIAANNAQYTVIAEYNEANPDNEVQLQAGDAFSVDVVQWVNEGRVDGGVMIEATFHRQVTAEDGPYHHLKDDVVYNEFAVIETWPLFNKKEQQLADAFDEAMKQVREEEVTNELSKEFYGKDLFKLLEK